MMPTQGHPLEQWVFVDLDEGSAKQQCYLPLDGMSAAPLFLNTSLSNNQDSDGDGIYISEENGVKSQEGYADDKIDEEAFTKCRLSIKILSAFSSRNARQKARDLLKDKIGELVKIDDLPSFVRKVIRIVDSMVTSLKIHMPSRAEVLNAQFAKFVNLLGDGASLRRELRHYYETIKHFEHNGAAEWQSMLPRRRRHSPTNSPTSPSSPSFTPPQQQQQQQQQQLTLYNTQLQALAIDPLQQTHLQSLSLDLLQTQLQPLASDSPFQTQLLDQAQMQLQMQALQPLQLLQPLTVQPSQQLVLPTQQSQQLVLPAQQSQQLVLPTQQSQQLVLPAQQSVYPCIYVAPYQLQSPPSNR